MSPRSSTVHDSFCSLDFPKPFETFPLLVKGDPQILNLDDEAEKKDGVRFGADPVSLSPACFGVRFLNSPRTGCFRVGRSVDEFRFACSSVEEKPNEGWPCFCGLSLAVSDYGIMHSRTVLEINILSLIVFES